MRVHHVVRIQGRYQIKIVRLQGVCYFKDRDRNSHLQVAKWSSWGHTLHPLRTVHWCVDRAPMWVATCLAYSVTGNALWHSWQ